MYKTSTYLQLLCYSIAMKASIFFTQKMHIHEIHAQNQRLNSIHVGHEFQVWNRRVYQFTCLYICVTVPIYELGSALNWHLHEKNRQDWYYNNEEEKNCMKCCNTQVPTLKKLVAFSKLLFSGLNHLVSKWFNSNVKI